jgi:hypothetical protein
MSEINLFSPLQIKGITLKKQNRGVADVPIFGHR